MEHVQYVEYKDCGECGIYMITTEDKGKWHTDCYSEDNWWARGVWDAYNGFPQVDYRPERYKQGYVYYKKHPVASNFPG